ncbi:MAG TPA: hypothetical protein VGB85_09745 [Nannocystis sp.]
MFRPTMLAAALAEVLIGKVRNIVDATVEISRHPSLPLALAQIYGTVVGEDPAEFWRENLDLALVVSQIVPRQVFVYYARTGEDAREGFLVAQRGQAIAADDSRREDIPPGKAGSHLPVTRLCEQMRISIDDLAGGFPGGPRIELSLMEPRGNDQTLLMTLVGQQAAGAAEAELGEEEGYEDEPPPPPPPSRGPSLTQGFGAPPSGPAAPAAAPARQPPGARPGAAQAKAPAMTAADDAKRRAADRAAEKQEIQQRSSELARSLKFAEDDRGIIVALPAELSETEVLRPFLVPHVERNAPEGLPADVRGRLEGKSIDFAVNVEFLSEVLIGKQPITKQKFEELATTRDLDGLEVKILEVLAPRLGAGTLLRSNGKNVFVSRKPDAPLPAKFLRELLAG